MRPALWAPAARGDTVAELILLNKPYRVLSQFTDGAGRSTLADFIRVPGFYPAGRLDFDSEGLILLCNDGRLQQRIADPRHKLWKTYLLQVEGEISDVAIAALREGVALNDGMTRPARVRRVPTPSLWPRSPPVRTRASVPTSWIEVSLREGRNRQLRRMGAAVGYPVLRLVRTAVGDWTLGELAPGASRHETVNLPREKAAPGRSGKMSASTPRKSRRP